MNEQRQTTWTTGASAAMLLATLLLVVVLPLAALLGSVLPGDVAALEALRQQLVESPLRWTLLRSLAVALLACGLASMLAVPAGFLAVRSAPWVGRLLLPLGLLPLVVPPFVSAALLRHFAAFYNQTGAAVLTGPLAVEGSLVALVVVYALHFLPLLLLGLVNGLSHLDPALEESARNLGAGVLRRWRRVVLPLATRGYLLGAALLLLKVIDDIGTPLVLGIEDMLAPQVLLLLGGDAGAGPRAAMPALILFVLSVAIAALAWSGLLAPLRMRTTTVFRKRPASSATWLLAIPLLPIFALATLGPLLWLLLVASGVAALPGAGPAQPALAGAALTGHWPTWTYAVLAGLLTVVGAAAFTRATLAGRTLARGVRFASTALYAVPGTVLALAYLHAGASTGFDIGTTAVAWLALALVVSLKMLPLAQRVMTESGQLLPDAALEAARNLGAGMLVRRLQIALPALRGLFAAVFLIGTGAAVLELSAALVLVSGPTRPLAAELFDLLRNGADSAAWAAPALLLVAVAASMLLTAGLLLRARRPRPSRRTPEKTMPGDYV